MVEADQALLVQRGEEVDREEWVAPRLGVHQSRELGGVFLPAMNRVGQELPDVRHREVAKDEVVHHHASLPDQIDHPRQRMCRAHLIVAVGADQEQILHLRVGDKMLE